MHYTISGTEIGAILGLNPYMTPMDLYMRKLGLIDPDPENEAMKWGIAAEHVVARRYARESKALLHPTTDEGYNYKNPLIHPDFTWWLGTPDRLIYPPGPIGPIDCGLLEIKIVGERMAHQWGDPPDGDVPEQYLTQVAWYMPLLGVEWADLAVQIGNRDYRVYRINRDRELEDSLRHAALEFIQGHLIPALPPPIDGSESSKRYLNYRYPQDQGPVLEPTDANILYLVERLRNVTDERKTTEAAEAELINQIKSIIGDCAGMKGDWGKITWTKNKDSRNLDYKTMAMDYPDVASRYMKPKPGARVFRAYFAKED